MIKVVLVDINTTPFAFVVFVDGDDTDGLLPG